MPRKAGQGVRVPPGPVSGARHYAGQLKAAGRFAVVGDGQYLAVARSPNVFVKINIGESFAASPGALPRFAGVGVVISVASRWRYSAFGLPGAESVSRLVHCAC